MNIAAGELADAYRIDLNNIDGTIVAYHGDTIVAETTRAKVMYETRLAPQIYIPVEDIRVPVIGVSDLQTFCPFKGTASYRDIEIDGIRFDKAIWCYDNPLPESQGLSGYVGFMPGVVTRFDTGDANIGEAHDPNLSGPLIDWLLRDAPALTQPEALVSAFAEQLIQQGVSISRLSIMIWSLHPLIAGKNYVWDKSTGAVSTYAPSYEIHAHPAFENSPLRHVSNGLGGVRHRLIDITKDKDEFPILTDLRNKGATDYVAMPLPFSDGRINVLTLTCDHPRGFTTANLGLVFECSSLISRLFEVFMLKDNAQSLLETYVGKRTGARVLGGDIRRGDGDNIDAAIMFCDMRGSTRLEQELGREAYISLLNSFFETVSNLVESHGGEVLKFIGDAVLAVFPADDDAVAACQNAIQAAVHIVDHLKNEAGANPTGNQCECAIGLAFGDVTYGNIGSRERLDFTVIGQAANIAARLGDFGKVANHPIVAARDMMSDVPASQYLGALKLHNVSDPIDAVAVKT
ncbi:MAG: DUF427 domain-containing protein [Pseudomonadota bacterium]